MTRLFHEDLTGLVRAIGDDTLFGVLGDANMYFVDGYIRSGGRYVAAAEEKAAVLMATGYTRRSGRTGVVTITHGPGVANAVAALVDASRDRTPVLVLAGETPPEDPDALQWLPQSALMASLGIDYCSLTDPHTLAQHMARIQGELHARPRPMVLGIPSNYMFLPDLDQLPVGHLPVLSVPEPDPEGVDRALGLILSSRRPLILAGRGASTPQAREALTRLADLTGARLATTLLAKDLFAGHPRNLGVFGTFSRSASIEAIARADTVFSFGAGLNRWTTADGTLLADTRLVTVHDRPDPSIWASPEIALVGDATVVATRMAEQLVSSGHLGSDPLSAAVSSTPATLEATERPAIDAYVAALDRALPGNRTVVCDGGRFMVRAIDGCTVAEPRAFVHTLSFGSIGLGLGNAVGAAVASPDSPTLLLVGDGGLMLAGWSELHTIAREGLDVVIAVFNDSAYGAELHQFEARGMDPSTTQFSWPAFESVAQAFGWEAHTIQPDQLDRIASALAHRDRPVLFNLVLDPFDVPTENEDAVGRREQPVGGGSR